MTKQTRHPEEFKIEAVKQITERKYPIADVVALLGTELRQVTDQRDILKKATAYFAKLSG